MAMPPIARDAALKGIAAGVNMEMVSTTYYDNGESLIKSGELDPRLIDEAVRNILRLKLRLGLFGPKGDAMPEGPFGPDARGVGRRQTTGRAKPRADRKMIMESCRSRNPSAKSPSSARWRIGRVDQLGAWAADRGSPSITPLIGVSESLR